MPMIFF